jgi:hypothetical protein
VDVSETAGGDSLPLPEMIYGSPADPFISMADATRLKVGRCSRGADATPVLVARQLATPADRTPAGCCRCSA